MSVIMGELPILITVGHPLIEHKLLSFIHKLNIMLIEVDIL